LTICKNAYWIIFGINIITKKDKKGYVLSILNSLAEYLNMMSGKMPSSQNIEVLELEPIYILYTRNAPEIYASLKKYW
jgi:hypothetical protein